jgi:uncharacterized protein
MMKPVASFLWQKLDHPGHDSCRLLRLPNAWRLSGMAVFCEAHRACHFHYEVTADAAFQTRSAKVVGYLGNTPIDIRIRSAGPKRWRVDGAVNAEVAGCIDVDLGFTPATNLLVLRRLALRVGQRAEAPAAYLGFPRMRFTRLPQCYERIGRTEYAYQAPTVGYAGTLQVSSSGVVIHYPGLFALVSPR